MYCYVKSILIAAVAFCVLVNEFVECLFLMDFTTEIVVRVLNIANLCTWYICLLRPF